MLNMMKLKELKLINKIFGRLSLRIIAPKLIGLVAKKLYEGAF